MNNKSNVLKIISWLFGIVFFAIGVVKTLTAQVNEALCKVLCHNLCVVIQSMYELDLDPTFRVEAA